MRILTCKDLKAVPDCSHLVSLSNRQVLKVYGHTDESIKLKCEKYYKGKYGLNYKIYPNIFK